MSLRSQDYTVIILGSTKKHTADQHDWSAPTVARWENYDVKAPKPPSATVVGVMRVGQATRFIQSCPCGEVRQVVLT